MAIKSHDLIVNVGPIVLEVQGDAFIEGCRIHSIVWEGSTSAGDTIELRHRDVNTLLWRGRATDTNTYLGITFGSPGHHCPFGFYLNVVDNGTVSVYLTED